MPHKPLRLGLPSAVRGAGAERLALPFAVRGIPGVGRFSQSDCADRVKLDTKVKTKMLNLVLTSLLIPVSPKTRLRGHFRSVSIHLSGKRGDSKVPVPPGHFAATIEST